MSILLSGDFNANQKSELRFVSKNTILSHYGSQLYEQIKYHIMLGDTGFGRPGNYKSDKEAYKSLAHRPFPILSVIGDDDPLFYSGKYDEVDIGIGETVYQINDTPFIAYLKKGKIYYIEGIKFLVLGGAKAFQHNSKNKTTQFNEEKAYWSEKEKKDLFMLLENDNKFDFVLSHTGPSNINYYFFNSKKNNKIDIYDEVSKLNSLIKEKIHYWEWICGHFRMEAHCLSKYEEHESYDNKGFEYLYRRTLMLNKINDAIRQYYVDQKDIKIILRGPHAKHGGIPEYKKRVLLEWDFFHQPSPPPGFW